MAKVDWPGEAKMREIERDLRANGTVDVSTAYDIKWILRELRRKLRRQVRLSEEITRDNETYARLVAVRDSTEEPK